MLTVACQLFEDLTQLSVDDYSLILHLETWSSRVVDIVCWLGVARALQAFEVDEKFWLSSCESQYEGVTGRGENMASSGLVWKHDWPDKRSICIIHL